MSKEKKKQRLTFLVPIDLNIRIDEEVLRRRRNTGERVSRAAIVISMLDTYLPPSREQVATS